MIDCRRGAVLCGRRGSLSTGGSPFLQLRGGDQACWLLGRAFHPPLPPVTVILVDDLDDVPCDELQSRLLARDQVVLSGIIVKLRTHEHLKKQARGAALVESLAVNKQGLHCLDSRDAKMLCGYRDSAVHSGVQSSYFYKCAPSLAADTT